MTVFELLQQYSFEELEPHLLYLFKVNGGHKGQTQQQALCIWKGLYACLIDGDCILPSECHSVKMEVGTHGAEFAAKLLWGYYLFGFKRPLK